jgi:hypothetical protein
VDLQSQRPIAAVADWVGVVVGSKKTVGISLGRHTSEDISTD